MTIIFDGRISTVGGLPSGNVQQGQYLEAGSPNGITIVQDPKGRFGQVARMEYINGTPKWTQGWRCEASVLQPPVGVRRCYQNSVMLADGWDQRHPKTIIYQQHGVDLDAGWGRPPVMEIAASGPADNAWIEVIHRADAAVAPSSMANAIITPFFEGRVDLTDWVTWTVDAIWMYDNTGYCWFYINGKKVAGFSGRMSCFNEAPDSGPFMKFGSYVQGGSAPPHSCATYHSGVLITDSLADITAETGQVFDSGYPVPISA